MVNKCSLHPTDASIILTYRCPMKCKMCNIWFNPTNKSEEIKASDLKSLPKLKFINLTGGEPFIREDLPEIVEECYKHTDRIVISTSGWFEDRVIALAKQFPIIGIRISIEGLSCKNDELRGHAGGFDKGQLFQVIWAAGSGIWKISGTHIRMPPWKLTPSSWGRRWARAASTATGVLAVQP